MATNINIDIAQFLEEFEAEYDFLYDHGDRVAGYDEAVTWGDEFISEHLDFVGEFIRYRGDILSSDREVAAFAFALEKYL